MKRIFLSVVIIVSLLLTTACTGNKQGEVQDSKAKKLSVVTTIFAPYDFVKKIAGEKADITMLLKPGEETHSYEPSAKDIVAIQNADLFIYVGGEDDVWVNKVMGSLEKKPEIIRLVDLVDVVNEEVKEGMQHVHSHEGHEGEEHHKEHDGEEQHKEHEGHEQHKEHDGEEQHKEHEGHEQHKEHDGEEHHKEHDGEEHADDSTHGVDEHVWLSISNAKQIVEKLKDRLVEIDADNKTHYEKNYEEYISKLNVLQSDYSKKLSNTKRNTIVVADRFPFRYLVDEYGINYYAAFTGCSTETEISANTMKYLIEKVREEKLPVVFKIEFSNGKTADAIAEEAGSKVLELHSLHNLSSDDFNNGEDYISVMRRNLKVLDEALN